MKKTSKLSTFLKLFIGLILAIAVSVLVKDYIKHNDKVHEVDKLESLLKQTSDNINQRCPIMVDSETRLDSTSISYINKELFYYYTLINLSKEDTDIEYFSHIIDSIVKQNVRTNKDLEPMKQNEITMSYIYKDRLGNVLSNVSVGSNDY